MTENVITEQVQAQKEKVYHFVHQGTVILYRINSKNRNLEIAVQRDYDMPVDAPTVYLLTIPLLHYTKNWTDSDDEVPDFKSIFRLDKKVQIEKVNQDNPSTCFAYPLENKPRAGWPDCELSSYFVQTCEIPISSITTLTKLPLSVSIKSVGNNYLRKT